MSKYISATFKTRQAAEEVLHKLDSIGIKDEQVGMVVSDETRGNSFNIEEGSKMQEGLASGAVAGGLVGGVVAALTVATTIVAPGLNLVVAGVVASAFAGIGAGATTGGLIGAIIGAGETEYEAKIYEDEIKNGAILVSVEPKNDQQRKEIKDIFERGDAYNLAA